MSFQGYQGVDRSDALTFERSKLVLRILSRFHALGYAFNEMKPDLFLQTATKLNETYFHANFRTWYTKFQRNVINITLDAVQQELPEQYVNKFKELASRDVYGYDYSY